MYDVVIIEVIRIILCMYVHVKRYITSHEQYNMHVHTLGYILYIHNNHMQYNVYISNAILYY